MLKAFMHLQRFTAAALALALLACVCFQLKALASTFSASVGQERKPSAKAAAQAAKAPKTPKARKESDFDYSLFQSAPGLRELRDELDERARLLAVADLRKAHPDFAEAADGIAKSLPDPFRRIGGEPVRFRLKFNDDEICGQITRISISAPSKPGQKAAPSVSIASAGGAPANYRISDVDPEFLYLFDQDEWNRKTTELVKKSCGNYDQLMAELDKRWKEAARRLMEPEGFDWSDKTRQWAPLKERPR